MLWVAVRVGKSQPGRTLPLQLLALGFGCEMQHFAHEHACVLSAGVRATVLLVTVTAAVN